MAAIELERVNKVYPDGTHAVIDVDLTVADGSLVVLVGPSGCGKTTLLRMVAGLEEISAGHVRIGGRIVNHLRAKERDIAMVFQNYALYPHMSVYDNMAFGLKLRGAKRADIDSGVRGAAELLGLVDQLNKRPRQISGGQRQRVAMGRAIVREPQAFLMDEPLSNLDAKLRVYMRSEIRQLQRRLGVTTMYVTHDQTEAMTLGDVVAVMRHGRVEQLDDPHDLYGRPRNLFVAGFIGSPAMNLAETTIERNGDGLTVRLANAQLRLDAPFLRDPKFHHWVGRRVVVGIRPEDMSDASLDARGDDLNCIATTCDLREEVGSDVYLHFRVAAPPVVTDDIRELTVDSEVRPGVTLAAKNEQESSFVARVSAQTRVREGERALIRVDNRAVHLFDPETGDAISR